MSNAPRSINIFGATGSIGQNTMDVILAHAGHFDVKVVSAHSNAEKLAEYAIKLGAQSAVLSDESGYETLRLALQGSGIKAAAGRQALLEHACVPVDLNVMAVVGMAGLEPILNAMPHCRYMAIANKEPLVAAGTLVMQHARECGVTILPLDSEHNAIFQVFDQNARDAVEKIILTASGGPFRTWNAERMYHASVEDALAHPNWVMGRKISIDSATLMNKALEVIEAHYLFDMPAEKIDVLVHPQSIVHSMVEYCDGSVLAQMGASDMRTPIANVLSYPERLKTPGNILKWNDVSSLTFESVDDDRFPAIGLAYASLKAGLYHSIALNAANEIAVEAFLSRRIAFGEIINCIRFALDSIKRENIVTLADVLAQDEAVRTLVQDYINSNPTRKTVSVL